MARSHRTSKFSKNGHDGRTVQTFGLESLEQREMLAADLGFVDDLTTLNDEFDNASSLVEWSRVHEVENWNADQLEAWDIDQTQAGRMVMMPHSVVWYQDYRGPMAFKEVSGDFIFTTEVHISDRDDIGGSDGDQVPGDGQFSLGGLMVRTPREINDPSVDWVQGSMADDGTNTGENYVFLSLGYGNGQNEFSLETKTTRNSASDLELTAVDSNTATLRIARIGDSIITLVQFPGEDWQVHRRYSRSDMPETVQLGLVSYTNWEKANDFDPFTHNGSVLAPGEIADPNPSEAFDPDLVAGFEFAHFARPQLPSDLEGVDLINSATDEQLLSFLGATTVESPADPVEGISTVLDAIGNVTMSYTEGSTSRELPATLPDGTPVFYTASVVESMEYQLDQVHDFYFDGSYHQNWGGQNEKWIRGDGDGWFYLLSTGELYEWAGSFESSSLLAELAPEIYNDPSRLFDVPSTASVNVVGNQLEIDPVDGYVGTFQIELELYLGEPGVSDPVGGKTIEASVINHAPILDEIADQIMSRLDDDLQVAFNATDADGDPLAVSASVDQPLAYQLDQTYDFWTAGDFGLNWGGQNEKWIRGDGDGWFYIMPTGDFYRWQGSFESSTLLATLDTEFYNDPSLLIDAQGVDVNVSIDGSHVVIDPANDFVGSVEIVVSVYDGLEWADTQFTVDVQNTQLTLTPLEDLVIESGSGISQTSIEAYSDAMDAELLDYSIEVIASPAHQLDIDLDLQTTEDFHLNWAGQNEKWLQDSEGSWYYILENGEFYQWNGSFESSTLLETLDPLFYEDPNLIADPETVPIDVSLVNGELFIDPGTEYLGSFSILVAVSDGFNIVEQTVNVSVVEDVVTEPLPVLMVIANDGFYYQEYADTLASLQAAGIEVVVAAATLDIAVPHAGSGQGAESGLVQPDITLFDASAVDYSTIVFVGGWGSSQYQYAYEGTYDNPAYNGSDELRLATNNLINDFVDQEKYVTAICHGVAVLAWARVDGESLLNGVTVSAWANTAPPAGGISELTRTQIEANGGIMVASGSLGELPTAHDDVYVDGNIITAENYDSAAAFGQQIAESITEQSYMDHIDDVYSNWPE